jgi:NADH dehydrogenase [ubiquinone] 1 alpha subcomplex assembly factor 1
MASRWSIRLGALVAFALMSLGGIVLPDEQASAGVTKGLRSAQWATVNDTVMGGRSSASLKWNEGGEVVWTGNLSLANNGGFVSIRSEAMWEDWSMMDGVEVVLEGAGREIQVSVQRRDGFIRSGGYRAMVHTQATGDTRVLIPFSAFVPKRFGREVRAMALQSDTKSLGQWGLLIADKREGPFRVTLKSIQGARYAKGTRPSATVRSRLMEAIERGVPTFNSGDAKGCAAIYAQALTSLSSPPHLHPGTWAHQMSKGALVRSAKQGPVDAAWTLRRAMDAILRTLSE